MMVVRSVCSWGGLLRMKRGRMSYNHRRTSPIEVPTPKSSNVCATEHASLTRGRKLRKLGGYVRAGERGWLDSISPWIVDTTLRTTGAAAQTRQDVLCIKRNKYEAPSETRDTVGQEILSCCRTCHSG
ncbi:unnamed protein product, partial [Ectocarpus sp. 8 AP-2014]